MLLLLTFNLVYFCFGPSGACVHHGFLFEVGELELVVLLNLTAVPAFCHPCEQGAGTALSASSVLENSSLLRDVRNSPWAFGPSQANWGFSG